MTEDHETKENEGRVADDQKFPNAIVFPIPPRIPRRWKLTVQHAIAFATILLVVVGIATIYSSHWEFTQTHRPKLIFSKAPELRDFIMCNGNAGEITTAKLRVWVHNAGNVDSASAVIMPFLSIVPEEHLDQDTQLWTHSLCSQDAMAHAPIDKGKFISANMAGNVDVTTSVSENIDPPGSRPAIVALYLCAFYTGNEANRLQYRTCVPFWLKLQGGSRIVVCNTAIMGTSDEYPGGCSN